MTLPPRNLRVFLDESGSTGDVTATGKVFDFHSQPIFVLGGLGMEDEAAFSSVFAELKARHRLQGPEVKSDAAWKKPAFYLELLAEIERLDLPLFLEVVDKRFFIAAQLVQALILRPTGGEQDHSPMRTFMRNAIAEYVTDILSLPCLEAFVEACRRADGPAVLTVYQALLEALAVEPDKGFSGFVRMVVTDARQDFLDDGPENPAVVRSRLPAPDRNAAGKAVWMLPNLTSLTNLYARLNTYTGGRLNDVTLVHDKQQEFEPILRTNKAAAEGLAEQGIEMAFGPADYVFRERADLIFVDSDRSEGIQAIDVIAGYAMRLTVDRMKGRAATRADGDWQFRRLLDQDEVGKGRGCNFVMTTAALRKIGVTSATEPYRLPW